VGAVRRARTNTPSCARLLRAADGFGTPRGLNSDFVGPPPDGRFAITRGRRAAGGSDLPGLAWHATGTLMFAARSMPPGGGGCEDTRGTRRDRTALRRLELRPVLAHWFFCVTDVGATSTAFPWRGAKRRPALAGKAGRTGTAGAGPADIGRVQGGAGILAGEAGGPSPSVEGVAGWGGRRRARRGWRAFWRLHPEPLDSGVLLGPWPGRQASVEARHADHSTRRGGGSFGPRARQTRPWGAAGLLSRRWAGADTTAYLLQRNVLPRLGRQALRPPCSGPTSGFRESVLTGGCYVGRNSWFVRGGKRGRPAGGAGQAL